MKRAWTERIALEFDIAFALARTHILPKSHRNREVAERLAKLVADRLEQSRWQVERLPPDPTSLGPMRGKKDGEEE